MGYFEMSRIANPTSVDSLPIPACPCEYQQNAHGISLHAINLFSQTDSMQPFSILPLQN